MAHTQLFWPEHDAVVFERTCESALRDRAVAIVRKRSKSRVQRHRPALGLDQQFLHNDLVNLQKATAT